MVWAASTTLLVGGHYVGVRSTPSAFDRFLRGCLTPIVVDGVDAPPNLSVAIGQEQAVGAPLHAVFLGHTPAVRTRSLRRLVWGVFRHLAGLPLPGNAEALAVRATAVIRDGEAVLVPWGLHQRVSGLDRRAARAGMTFLDAPRVLLDLDDPVLVVEDLPWNVGDQPETGLEKAGLVDRRESVVTAGRYRLRGWVFDEPHEPPSAAAKLFLAMRQVENAAGVGGQRTLDALGGQLSTIRSTARLDTKPWLAVEALERLFD